MKYVTLMLFIIAPATLYRVCVWRVFAQHVPFRCIYEVTFLHFVAELCLSYNALRFVYLFVPSPQQRGGLYLMASANKGPARVRARA